MREKGTYGRCRRGIAALLALLTVLALLPVSQITAYGEELPSETPQQTAEAESEEIDTPQAESEQEPPEDETDPEDSAPDGKTIYDGTIVAVDAEQSASGSSQKDTPTQAPLMIPANRANGTALPEKIEIREFNIQAFEGGTDVDGKYVWNADTSAADHRFSFRVNYALSGTGEIPEELIEIRIPLQILKDKNDKFADYFEMSVPHQSELNEEGEQDDFAYYVDDETDEIVVYNCKTVSAAVEGYFEVSYLTSKTTFNYRDMDPSDPFHAEITVQTADEDDVIASSEEIPVYINTSATVVSTEKRYPTLFKTWQSAWGTAPEDAGDYYYLVWEICSNISDNVTQSYTFRLEDDVTGDHGAAEVCRYKLQGGFWGTDNQIENQTSSGKRYDYVLTRHRIETYAELEEYTIQNHITVTCIPTDDPDSATTASSSKSFTWKNPTFIMPIGHFWSEKMGNFDEPSYYGDYARYDLDKLQLGEVTSLDDIQYGVTTYGFPYPWTLGESGDPRDPYAYGTNTVTWETTDETLWLEGEEDRLLTADDFEFRYLTFSITNRDVEFDQDSQTFITTDTSYIANESIVFYAKFGDSDEWVEAATYNYRNARMTYDSQYVTSASYGRIDFRPNCVAWKIVTENKHYFHNLDVYPYISLKNSGYVMGYIAEKDEIHIYNQSAGEVKDYKDATIFRREDDTFDRLRRTQRDSSIKKRVTATGNQVKKKQYVITWSVDASETYTVGTGFKEYLRQNSGTFYDLLPKGCTLDATSLAVRTERGYLQDNEFTFRQLPNYNGSGRTMLIVEIETAANYYTLFYNTIHPWDSIKDFGTQVLNPVAYETGNIDIADGCPDDGGSMSEENKALFTDLDASTDAQRFIYTEQPHWIGAITAALTGLTKKALGSDKTDYSYDAVTAPGETYSYRLRMMNTYTTTSKNLIFFDSLENFTDEDESIRSDWHGILQSIDVSQLTTKGIAPVIYYSTVSDLDIDQHHDLDDTSIWITASAFRGDLAQVKAFAIDMRKTTGGGDFTLAAGESVTAIVYMTAPSTVPDKQGEYPYAYNNVYLNETLVNTTGEEDEVLVHQDYTSVALRVVGDFKVHKVNAENHSESIGNIQFRLYGTSYYGTEIDTILTTNASGRLTFKDIEMGTYHVLEYEGNADWQEDHTEHIVTVTGEGKVLVDGEDYTDIVWTVENKPRVHANLTFKKQTRGTTVEELALLTKIGAVDAGSDTTIRYDGKDYYLISKDQQVAVLNTDKTDQNEETRLSVSRKIVSTNPIPNTTFKLSGTSDYGNDVLMFAVSNENGQVTFANIEQGSYELVEIQENPEYVPLTDEVFTVSVDANGNVGITSESEWNERTSDGQERIYNEPRYWDIQIRKIDADNETIWLEGAEFHLTGISDLGTEFDLTATSDTNGIAKFRRLEKGSYVLQETKAPAGVDETGNISETGNRNYILDPSEYIVTIDDRGNFTIERLEQDDYGEYVVQNTRAQDGKITVIKQWIDYSEDGSDRPIPVLHLSTVEPTIRHGIAVTVRWIGDTESDRPEDVTVHLMSRSKDSGEDYKVIESSGSGQWKKNDDNTWVYMFAAAPEHGMEYAVYTDPITSAPYISSAPNQSSPQKVEGKVVTVTESLPNAKYAVSLYGICHDKDAAGHTLGLTFGPATGANYVTAGAYQSHRPTGNTRNGNAHRCIHNDDWATIIYWASKDPYVYEQCMGSKTTLSCTKSVTLTINDALRPTRFAMPAPTTGDGPGMIGYYQMEWRAMIWNCYFNSKSDSDTVYPNRYQCDTSNGWKGSNIRAVLNGVSADTNDKVWARWQNITESNSLLSCFPAELQAAIVPRETLASSGKNNDNAIATTYDKLWLFSLEEFTGKTFDYSAAGEGSVYQRQIQIGLTTGDYSKRVAYWATTDGSADYRWWLRSISIRPSRYSAVLGIADADDSGIAGTQDPYYSYGIAPGFSIGIYPPSN